MQAKSYQGTLGWSDVKNINFSDAYCVPTPLSPEGKDRLEKQSPGARGTVNGGPACA